MTFACLKKTAIALKTMLSDINDVNDVYRLPKNCDCKRNLNLATQNDLCETPKNCYGSETIFADINDICVSLENCDWSENRIDQQK